MDGNRDHLVKFMIERFRLVPCVFAEVGVWTGTFSARVLREVNVREAHLIDPWKYSKALMKTSIPSRPYCIDVPFDGEVSQELLDRIHTAVVDKFSPDARVTVHREFSVDAAARFPDGHFDWVYVDGDHSRASVDRDLSEWSRKVKPDGFLSGDDYCWGGDQGSPVKSSVDGFLSAERGFQLISNEKGQWLIRRNGL